MALIETTRAASGQSFADRVSFALNTVRNQVAAYLERRATRAALHGLSDRELDDIGLSRSEIDTLR
ncbi:DUF1127 domain-containing protein [Actibacterium sp. 188UL27-1]|uniref:DUF1127 domain-containing protein n=1 Tax=Actibacterium sp. 188UL27-1 TaxID=2786961 RepID=UPI00195BF975|nr:DUF1127 domain-containing protein [Actibacterium sp. 188UL27-1]MBM7066558.1 DUF1127 domain-containing protein [Actibacterium sp. 188UL27-1]